jgi:hypothetical protein
VRGRAPTRVHKAATPRSSLLAFVVQRQPTATRWTTIFMPYFVRAGSTDSDSAEAVEERHYRSHTFDHRTGANSAQYVRRPRADLTARLPRESR